MTTIDRSPVNVVVGAGQAGAHAAIAMRRAGFSGRIVLIGDEPEQPYDRTPLSKAMLAAPDDRALNYFFQSQAYRDANIEMQLNTRVNAIDAQAARLHISGFGQTAVQSIGYDRLVLATGSRASRLKIPGGEKIRTLRTVGDAVALRSHLRCGQRVVCIGGGVIGLELASAARTHGCEVTVVEIGSSLMSRSLHPDIASHVAERHVRAGVEILFGTQVVAIEPDRVQLLDGSYLPADLIVAGVGVQRNISLAATAGIATGRGIFADGMGRTSFDGIYAAGEVAEYFSRRAGTHIVSESWRHAQDHGSHVGRVAAGVEESYDEVPWFWSDQHGNNLQVAGSALEAARILYRGDPAANAFSTFFLDGESNITGAFGFNAGRDVSAAIRLIRRGGKVDPQILSDTNVTPQRLIALHR